LSFFSIIVADHNHHHCHQNPPSPCLLLHPSIVSCVPPPSSPIFCRGRVLFGVVTIAASVAATVSVSLLPPTYSV
jgi:hypothetical protein